MPLFALFSGCIGVTLTQTGPYFPEKSAIEYRMWSIAKSPSELGLELSLQQWQSHPDDDLARTAVLGNLPRYHQALKTTFQELDGLQQVDVAVFVAGAGRDNAQAELAGFLLPWVSDPAVMESLVRSLDQTTTPGGQDGLLSVLEGDASVHIRKLAASGLIGSTLDATHKRLVAFGTQVGQPQLLRRLALHAMTQLTPADRSALLTHLGTTEDPEALLVSQRLQQLSPQEVAPADAALDINPEAAALLLATVIDLDDPTLDHLRSKLAGPAKHQIAAGLALCTNRADDPVPGLISRLDEPANAASARRSIEACHLRSLPHLRTAKPSTSEGQTEVDALVALLSASKSQFPSGKLRVLNWSTLEPESSDLITTIDHNTGRTDDPYQRFYEHQTAWLAGDRGAWRSERLKQSREAISSQQTVFFDNTAQLSGEFLDAHLLDALGQATEPTGYKAAWAKDSPPHLPAASLTGALQCATESGGENILDITTTVRGYSHSIENPEYAALMRELASVPPSFVQRSAECRAADALIATGDYRWGSDYGWDCLMSGGAGEEHIPNPVFTAIQDQLATLQQTLPVVSEYQQHEIKAERFTTTRCTGEGSLAFGTLSTAFTLDFEASRRVAFKETRTTTTDLPRNHDIEASWGYFEIADNDPRPQAFGNAFHTALQPMGLTQTSISAQYQSAIDDTTDTATRRMLWIWTEPSLLGADAFAHKFIRSTP